MYKAPQIHPSKHIKRVSWKIKSSKIIHRLITDYLRSEHADAQGQAPWFADSDINVRLGSWDFGIALVAHTNLYIEKTSEHGKHDPVLDRLVPMLAYIRANIANATERMSIDAMYGKIRHTVWYYEGGYGKDFDFATWDSKFKALTK